MKNTELLDSVVLTPTVVAAWGEVCQATAALGQSRGIEASSIPDEQAEVLPSGELRIFVGHPAHGVLCELIIPVGEWSWLE